MSDKKLKNELKEIKKALNYLENLSLERIHKILKYLSDKYYNEDEHVVSDEVFDYIKEHYEKKSGKKFEVGSKIKNEDNKVALPFYMKSLDKIKPSMKEFDTWINKYKGSYYISYKLDGISILVTKKDGKVNMYSRGDGYEGEDLTRFIPYVNLNIKKLKEGDAIRGEAVFTKDNFKKVKKILEENKKKDKSKKNREYKQSRNVVSGLLKNKTPEKEVLKYVDIVFYWVLSPNMKISEQMLYLENEKKVLTVEYEIKNKITTKYLSEMLTTGRDNYKYQIDGIVVVDNSQVYIQKDENPKYAFSFKQVMTDQIMESIVVDVEWDITKDKYLKPTVVIEPIELLDCTVERATANNAQYIYDNKINVGTVVQMIKANDIIPNIHKIITPSELNKPKMPTDIKYEWNETRVDIIGINLNKKYKNRVTVKQLMMFFDTLKIKNIGEGVLTKLVDEGYNDIFKILKAKKEDLYDIEGFGKTLITKIYKNIDSGLKNVKLYKLMTVSQLLGRGIGDKKFKLITDEYPDIILIYKTKGKKHTGKIINTIKGFSDITTDKIIDGFNDFIEFYDKLVKVKPDVILKINKKEKEKEKENKNSKYEKYRDKKIVFTGFRLDKDIESKLEEDVNVKITTSVSKNTDFLVAVNINETSKKINDAKKNNVKILSKEEFLSSIS